MAATTQPALFVPTPPKANHAGLLRRLVPFLGPGLLVSVGYMDPGNWATDIAAGSRYGYSLVWVVVFSSLAAMLLQHLAVKLGLVTGLDLAQACRKRYGRRASVALWLLAEVQIVACDVAEVVGAAMALQLLFGLPLKYGIVLTIFDVLVLLMLERRGARPLQALVAVLVVTVAVGLGFDWVATRPDLRAVLRGVLPEPAILRDRRMLWIAAGIVGATVMPHNLYLHSAEGRRQVGAGKSKRDAVRLATADSSVSLSLAMVVNVGLLALSAAAFRGTPVDDIREAHRLLAGSAIKPLAAVCFAVALLAAGESASVTGTMAGRIIMEGFVKISMPPAARRLLTRSLAIVPAGIVLIVAGEKSMGALLVASQVVLALQLPFAAVPLVRMTSDRRWMGAHANGPWMRRIAWGITGLVTTLGILVVARFVL